MENETSPPITERERVSKQDLIRDAFVFQIKLVIDGIRDFVLIPTAFIATIISLLKPGNEAGREFYEVVALGKDSEKRINLFGGMHGRKDDDDAAAADVDQVVERVEDYLQAELKGERLQLARERLQRVLDRFRQDSSNDG